jgi:uncharacterized protein YvpB
MKKSLSVLVIILGILLALVPSAATASLFPNVRLPVRGYAQQLPLSCESRSAVDVAAYWGVHISELEFFNRLPKTDNPNTGFVGNVYDYWGQLPPNGYGVHAEPVAALLRAYGLPAQARYGMGLEGLKAELAAGRPVILWATPRMASQPVESYRASDGQMVSVIRYEHTVIAVGYTSWAVYVIDAGNGALWAYSNQSLLNAWNKLGQMSVVVQGERAEDQPVSSPPVVGRLSQPTRGETAPTATPSDQAPSSPPSSALKRASMKRK